LKEINAKHGTRLPDDLLAIIQTGAAGINIAGVSTLPLTEVTPRLPYSVPPQESGASASTIFRTPRHQRGAAGRAGQLHETGLLHV